MGGKDLKTRKVFDQPQNFADAVNMAIGEQIISPGNLKPYSEHNISTVQGKYRETIPDNVKMYDYKHDEDHLLTIIFLENNDYIDYSYVAHILFEMTLKVIEEINEVKAMHRRKKDLKGSRYIGSFDETDRITAVAALVIYTGHENINLPDELSDLYSHYDPRLEGMVLHFKAKMLNVYDIDDRRLGLAKGDLGKYFKVVRCGGDAQKIRELMETSEFYEVKDESIADVIYDHLHLSKKTRKAIEEKRKKGAPIHMSEEFKFFSDEEEAAIKNKGVAEGKKEGRKEGRKEERSNIIRNMIRQHFTNEQIRSVSGESDEQIDAIRRSLK